MPSYKIEVKVKAEQNAKLIREIIENTFMDLAIDITKINVSQVRRPGRPSGAASKVRQWVDGRNKPFEANTFEKFTGLSKPAAWHRLNRLVAAGVYKKEVGPRGEVLYYKPGYRPDNSVVAE